MILTTFLDYLFGCHHSNLSRVFTIGRRTYRVCCGCGAQFEYSLERMVISRRRTRSQVSLGVVENAIHMAE
jgi:hypothetical protein